MPTIEHWPDQDGVAVIEDDGQVRLLILRQPDEETLARWQALYPHLPIADAVREFEEPAMAGRREAATVASAHQDTP